MFYLFGFLLVLSLDLNGRTSLGVAVGNYQRKLLFYLFNLSVGSFGGRCYFISNHEGVGRLRCVTFHSTNLCNHHLFYE